MLDIDNFNIDILKANKFIIRDNIQLDESK